MDLERLAHGATGGAPVFEVETPVVFGAFDHLFDDESVDKMGFPVGADAIGRVELSLGVTIDRVGLVVVIDANDI